MNRKEFLKKSMEAGLCCAAVIGLGRGLSRAQDRSSLERDWIDELEARMITGSETPDWRKVEKSGEWIKDLMDNMNAMLDDETKIRLLQANGRSCYQRAFGAASEEKPPAEAGARIIASLQMSGNEVKREKDKTVIIYRWGRKHQNPTGLVMQDGYCMCPIVESGPPDLSPTYCICSTGYVKESFERMFGRTVNVELLESLKTGGNDCVFRIELPGRL
jgi:hypothetical protein